MEDPYASDVADLLETEAEARPVSAGKRAPSSRRQVGLGEQISPPADRGVTVAVTNTISSEILSV